MNKLSYKLTYQQALCLRDFALKRCEHIPLNAELLLASAVAVDYTLKLSVRLLNIYPKQRKFSLPMPFCLALVVLTRTMSLNMFNPLETAIVLPILRDTVEEMTNPKPIVYP